MIQYILTHVNIQFVSFVKQNQQIKALFLCRRRHECDASNSDFLSFWEICSTLSPSRTTMHDTRASILQHFKKTQKNSVWRILVVFKNHMTSRCTTSFEQELKTKNTKTHIFVQIMCDYVSENYIVTTGDVYLRLHRGVDPASTGVSLELRFLIMPSVRTIYADLQTLYPSLFPETLDLLRP